MLKLPYEIENEKKERRAVRALSVVLAVVTVALLIAGAARGAQAPAEKDVALWLARSCVGEAGWKAHGTGECAAIFHVYKKRSEISGLSLYKVMRKYSAATKPRPGRKNQWVLHLNRAGEKPKHWPAGAKWQVYQSDWGFALVEAERFLRGDTADPLPDALHYGCIYDRWRARLHGWKELETPNFRNDFYTVRRRRTAQ